MRRLPPLWTLLVLLSALSLTARGQGYDSWHDLPTDLDSSSLSRLFLPSMCQPSPSSLTETPAATPLEVLRDNRPVKSTLDEASSCTAKLGPVSWPCPAFAAGSGACDGIGVFLSPFKASDSDSPGGSSPGGSPGGDSGLYLLHDVYVSFQGHVFNSTHVLFQPEAANQDFSFAKGTAAVEYQRLVYLMAPDTAYTAAEPPAPLVRTAEDSHSHSHHRRPTYRHLLEGLLPSCVSLAPVIGQLGQWPVLLPHSPAVKEITGAVLGIDVSGRAVHAGDRGPADLEEEQESYVVFARTLVLPYTLPCSRPSADASPEQCAATWHPIRMRHLIPPAGLPLLSPHGAPLPPPRGGNRDAEPGTPAAPPDWRVVLALSSRHRGSPSDAAVANALFRHVPKDRVSVLHSRMPLVHARSLFSRSIILVGYSSAGLANMVFMPPQASVIELCAPHRCLDLGEGTAMPPAPLPISFRHLAGSCGLQWQALACRSTRTGPPLSAGLRPSRGRLAVDCLDQIQTFESRLLEALSRYGIASAASGTEQQGPGTAREGAGAAQEGAGGGGSAAIGAAAGAGAGGGAPAEDPRVAALLQGRGPSGVPDELDPLLWDAAYNGTNGANRRRTVLFNLEFPPRVPVPAETQGQGQGAGGGGVGQLEFDLPGVSGRIPGVSGLSGEELAAFLRWQECVGRKGQWVRNGTPRALPWEYTGYYNTCDVREEQEGGLVASRADRAVEEGVSEAEWKVRETLKYEWRVPEGECVEGKGRGGWERMDGRDLCRLASKWKEARGEGGKGLFIFMVGDSMTQQFTQTFMNMLLWGAKDARAALKKTACYAWVPHEMHEHCSKYVLSDSPGVCPGGLTLQFVSNRWLTIGDNFVAKESVPWFETRGLVDADVIIINRGAHYVEDAAHAKGVKDALWFLRTNFPEKLIMYRTTPPGHANCTGVDRPLEKALDPATLPYNWGQFLHQNEIAKPMVKSVGGVLLDVVPFMALRADGHRSWHDWDNPNFDCLHYCTPGPYDVVSELFYNVLRWLLAK